jgi:hypothetical protein
MRPSHAALAVPQLRFPSHAALAVRSWDSEAARESPPLIQVSPDSEAALVITLF